MDAENDRGAGRDRSQDTADAERRVQELLERGPVTGGTLAGEDVVGGSVIRREGPSHRSYGWDSIGNRIAVPPEMAGTVAGNTTAADAILARNDDEPVEDLTQDLGPEGTIVQEIGGEARH
jgi:hypothetical protein